MTPDKIFVTLVGSIVVGFVWWFFLGKKEKYVKAGGSVEILVDGGYKPSLISIKRGEITKLKITRTDSNTCLEEFVLPDFKVKRYLPLNKEVVVNITSPNTGVFKFHCGMNMYHGKIIVE